MKIIKEMHFLKLFFLIFLSAFIGFTPSSFGQKATKKSSQLVPYRVGAKWGFSDNSGKILVQPKYNEIEILNENLFKVRSERLWGIVNKSGKLIHDCVYSSINHFIPDNTQIKLSLYDYNKYGNWGKQGVIDSLGNFLVPPLHTYSYPIKDDLFIAVDYNLDNQGNQQEKYGIYREGEIVIPLEYDKVEANTFGQIFLMKGDNLNRGYPILSSPSPIITFSGLLKLNRDSVSVDKPKYFYASAFSDGLAAIYHPENKYQFVDKDEELAFDRKFSYLRLDNKSQAFSNGLAAVSEDGKLFGYINNQGQTIIPFEFSTALPFKDGLAIVQKGKKFGIIDTKGNVVVPFEYISLEWASDPGVYQGSTGNAFGNGYVNLKGQRSALYHYIQSFYSDLAMVKENNHVGYINKEGKEVIPLIYQEGSGFSKGLATVKKEGKWGFINSNGKVIIPFKFLKATNFKNGRAVVSIKKNTWIYIDQKGKKVSPEIIYDDNFSPYSEYYPPLFYKGFVSIVTRWQEKVTDEGIKYNSPIYRVINDKGKSISKHEYTHVSTESLDFGLIYVCDDSGCGFLNTKGQVVITLDYHFVQENDIYFYGSFLHNGLLKVYTPDREKFLGFMSTTGQKYWQE